MNPAHAATTPTTAEPDAHSTTLAAAAALSPRDGTGRGSIHPIPSNRSNTMFTALDDAVRYLRWTQRVRRGDTVYRWAATASEVAAATGGTPLALGHGHAGETLDPLEYSLGHGHAGGTLDPLETRCAPVESGRTYGGWTVRRGPGMSVGSVVGIAVAAAVVTAAVVIGPVRGGRR